MHNFSFDNTIEVLAKNNIKRLEPRNRNQWDRDIMNCLCAKRNTD